MSIPTIARRYEVVAYGAEHYMQRARQFAERFGAAGSSIEPFHVRDRRSVHPDWMERAEPSLRRVSEQWERLELEFPTAEVNAAW